MSGYRALAFTLQLLSVLAVCMHASEAIRPSPQTLVVYLRGVTAQNGTVTPNATIVPVAGFQGKPFNLQQFGTIFVVDDNITATASATSARQGQALGTLTVVSLNGTSYQVSLTLVFTAGPNANSTLVLLGVVNTSQPVGVVAVVGGTGAFTYASGNATFQGVSVQGSLTVQRVIVTYKLLP